MYCVNCGKEIGEQNFCQHCGAQIGNASVGEKVSCEAAVATAAPMPSCAPTYVAYPDRMQQRQDELQVLQKLVAYFSLKSPQYNEYDNVALWIDVLRRGVSSAALIWGIILLGIVTPIMSVVAMPSYDYDLMLGNMVKESNPGATVTVYICLIVGVLLIASYIFQRIRNKKRLAQAVDRYCELNEELYAHYCGYANCPIGPEYINPANLQVVIQTIQSGRADTIKEALNILVEDAHRARMEDLSQKTAQYAQRTAASAAETARRAGQTARNTSVSAFFATANYLRR